MNRAFLLGALALVVGCGSEEARPRNLPPDSSGGRSSKGGQAGAMSTAPGGGLNIAGSAGANPHAPTVKITSPLGTVDVNDVGHVVIEDLVDVTCQAEAASAPGSTVNVATARVVMLDATGATSADPTSTTPLATGVTARFNLSAVSGWMTFQCSAQDSSSLPVTGTSDPVKVLVDHGPTITFKEPAVGAAWALKTPLKVAFTITPSTFASVDPLAATDTVLLSIDGRTVPVAETAPGSGEYSSTVSLSDPNIFPASEVPNGSTVIRASVKNKRGATAEPSININVDSTPPVVTITSPTDSSVVGGEIQLKFNVKDPVSAGTNDPGSGVASTSTVVKLNYAPFAYDAKSDRWSFDPVSGDFVFKFRESDLASSTAQATIGITAGDLAGNSGTAAGSLTLYIDNVPPLVDLDPPTVREIYIDSDRLPHYSNAFDPLGEAINDRSIVAGAANFRAFVWDRTNEPLQGANIEMFAATNPSTVRLWMQANVDQPLLKDTNGDGYCDAIDEGPATAPAIPIELRALQAAGISPRLFDGIEGKFFFDDTRYLVRDKDGDVAAPYSGNGPLENITVPDWLCANTSDMIRVPQHSMKVSPAEPVVYAHTPSSAGLGCTGNYWEFSAALQRTVRDGWVCFAAQATDKVGNVGISPVMALCYDDPDPKSVVPSCATSKQPVPTPKPEWVKVGAPELSNEAPSCKVTCKLPPREPIRHIDLR